ncbi:MAG TPA: flagellar motor stator protein MotA [Burkholderiales bacterium]|nr:flagellar motor stator protein MotA [Burkholderiales bacterium]
MAVLFGYIVVLASVFGGFALLGGHLGAMMQPVELLMIAGAAGGAFFVGNSGKAIMATVRSLPLALRGSHYNKVTYMELMALLYDILAKARKEGLMSLEADVERPHESPLFSKYRVIVQDKHAIEFMTDYLRLMVGGNLNAMELESLMDSEIETHHLEGEVPVQVIQRTGDALPAFGIVAAVMGVVHTMQSVGLPPAELGRLIASALVGTFLGILLAYGFVGPLAGRVEQRQQESSKLLQCIKVTLLASLNGYSPALAVEFGRKVVNSTERPSFEELEQHLKRGKAR